MLQFRAIADQLFRNPEYHKHVRKQVIKQLKHHKKLYEAYVPMKYRRYLRKMKKTGEWGDHLTLQAAADRFGAKICLITSFRDTCFIEILPKDGNPNLELWLSFWSEVHYNSLYASAGDELNHYLYFSFAIFSPRHLGIGTIQDIINPLIPFYGSVYRCSD
ncbi:hypothetical protein C1H46_044943 [Malus baccata]|uniref:OTU domain-containing protein n=1 Tax=Malus baccata TaxID=106549 RepID=A0A540K5M1_MALBA|nr:hypothetical protein C1H46_044943 [Malus baccata]